MQDAWDGYRANRNRILDHLVDGHIDNAIILSGDSHGNWVSDLARKLDILREHYVLTSAQIQMIRQGLSALAHTRGPV